MPARPLVHFEIHGRDRKKLEEFYRKLFGWEIQSMDEIGYSLVQPVPPPAGAPPGLGGGIGQREEGPMVTVYFQVPDPAATIREAEAMGGAKLMDPQDVPGGPTIAMFADPEGNPIGLVKGD